MASEYEPAGQGNAALAPGGQYPPPSWNGMRQGRRWDQLNSPMGIAHHEGELFVSDTHNDRIQARAAPHLHMPLRAWHAHGHALMWHELFVSDTHDDRIQARAAPRLHTHPRASSHGYGMCAARLQVLTAQACFISMQSMHN